MNIIDVYKDIFLTYAYLNNFPAPKEYQSTFLVTNEPIAQYYNIFPIKNGRVLTVASSGDHILQAVCNGANIIDAFDNNKIALYFTKLKIAAVKALNQDEFNEYYRDFENLNYYDIVRNYLDSGVKTFFDTFFYSKKYKRYIDSLINELCFVEKDQSFYAFNSNYDETKKNLNSTTINYYNSSLHTIIDKVPGDVKYDAMFLSNIYSWLCYEEMLDFNRLLEEQLASRLNDNGMIAVYASPYEEIAYIEEYSGKIKDDDEKVYVYYKKK